ncbi:hypothetical protein H0H92_010819 [Tricholoma furcatifolium]|nr:hypothetical protein H0H92_010819 [Tricholoma furcatifolium]
MAQVLIFSAYILFGSFVYAFQGQFTWNPAYQGLSSPTWQTVGYALSFVSGILAAGLSGNIGLKVLYIKIVEGGFNGPRLMTFKGRYLWTVLVLVYWSIAFLIVSAIPYYAETVLGFIPVIAAVQLSFTFPFFLRLGYDVITDAMAADAPFAPGQGSSGRVDSWSQWSRWRRVCHSLYNFL